MHSSIWSDNSYLLITPFSPSKSVIMFDQMLVTKLNGELMWLFAADKFVVTS